jgi:hypothetical protein
MGSSESASTLGQASPANLESTPPLSSEKARDRPYWQVWAIALAAGVAAGLVSWRGGELVNGVFQPQLFDVTFPMGVTLNMPTAKSKNVADYHNAILALTILGGVTGLALGFAGGLAGRSPTRGLIVGLGGLAVGGLVGALSSYALLPLFYHQLVPDVNDLLSPMMIHAGIWMAIGAVGGLAFAMGLGRWRRVLVAIGGACLGALGASVLFHLLSEVLFPDSGSTDAVASSSIVRLLAMLLVTLLVAVGAARGSQSRVRRPPSPVAAH